MDAEERLRKTVKWRTAAAPEQARTLGSAAEEFLSNLEPRCGQTEKLVEAFNRLLPEVLASHCQIDTVSAGRVKVLVDSPSYLHELRLCKRQLLYELRQECPRMKIKDIKLAIG